MAAKLYERPFVERGRERKNIGRGRAHVPVLPSTTLIVDACADLCGNALSWSSAGSLGSNWIKKVYPVCSPDGGRRSSKRRNGTRS